MLSGNPQTCCSAVLSAASKHLVSGLVPGVLAIMVLLSACQGASQARETTNTREAAQFNAELGAKYLQRGELDQANEKLAKALEQDTNNPLAHISFARLQQQIDKPVLAKKHFKRALDLQPGDAAQINSYGVFLCETGEVDEAIENFRSAAANPFYRTPEYALDNAGLCLLDADRPDQAEKFLRDALRRNPRFPNALLHMAQLTFGKNQLGIADAYLGRFQRYGQDTPASLLLGMNIKRSSGDIPSAQNYANRLLSDFPKSREAGQYLSQPL